MIAGIRESKDVEETTYYENRIACAFTAPIMLFAAIVNFVIGYFYLHNEFLETFLISAVFLAFCIAFNFLLFLKLHVKLQTIIITVIFSVWFIMMFTYLYKIFGSAVWIMACIQIAFAMFRIKKYTGYTLTFITLIANIYFLFDAPDYIPQVGTLYYLPLFISIFIFLIAMNIIHKTSTDRFYSLQSQYNVVVRQKNSISILYDEVSKTEYELRKQNKQLLAYTDEIRKRDQKLYDLAYFDYLTGLPNRKLFMEKLNVIIDEAAPDHSPFYVIFVDIDSFKKINDTMGHQIGDDYIRLAADRLKKSIRPDDLLGRLGGDEFALLIKRNISEGELLHEIEGLREIFSRPIAVGNREIRSTASFGISVYPRDGMDASELLKTADMSMYKAKEYGKNNVKFFEKYMQEEIEEKARIENKLYLALERHEFFLVFQPQYTINKDKIRGLEALIRWNSPELGVVQPMNFIPIVEENRMIIPLGEWILRSACEKFKKLQEQYHLDFFISVNISAIQLMDENFVNMVKRALKDTGLQPEYLELEITESVFIESLQHAVETLKKLKQLGIRIALDDFGTQYSSLSYLESLPIDTLKIDRSFMNEISLDPTQVKIIEQIINLGHILGFSIIAEGVENDYQLQYLKNHSCDYIQGFIYDKPLDEGKLSELFSEKKD